LRQDLPATAKLAVLSPDNSGDELRGLRVIFRAAFWIGVGYLVIQPGQPDGVGTAGQIGAALIETGSRAVLDYTAEQDCPDFRCSVIRAAVLTSNPGPAGDNLAARPEIALLPKAPVPPPRPEGAR
jgi:hypothetical protein